MKKTVTTILSLALAMLLVSSLGNGTVYGHEREVVILDCGPDPFEPGARPLVVTESQSSTADDFGITVAAFMESSPTTCAEGIAIVLNKKNKKKFKMENVDTILTMFGTVFSRYTFVRK